jgi:gas vesicle protein
MQDNNHPSMLWFVAGIAIGATVALLFAPASGQVTRRRISRKAEEGREAISEFGEDIADKGRDLYKQSKKLVDDVAHEASELFDRGRKLVEG